MSVTLVDCEKRSGERSLGGSRCGRRAIPRSPPNKISNQVYVSCRTERERQNMASRARHELEQRVRPIEGLPRRP